MNTYTTISVVSLIILLSCFFVCSCQQGWKGKQERAMYDHLHDFGQKVAKQNKLKLLACGDVTSAPTYPLGGAPLYCLSFASQQQIGLDSARIYAANLVEQFWEDVQKDKYVQIYAQYLHELTKKTKPLHPTLIQVGYKMSFWDSEMNRQQKPYIAQFEFWGKKFRYYYADPETQKLVPAFEESYEDAIAFKNKMQTMPGQKI